MPPEPTAAEQAPLYRRVGRAALALGVLLLAACAGRAPRAGLPAIAGDPQAHQAQREAALAAAPAWSLAGRVAVSNGKDGGSGRIEWRQDGPRYEVSLSAPVTRQSWRLSGQPGQATLAGLEGGPRQGSDAGALLREATRWEIPVEALSAWIRASAAGGGTFGDANYTFGDDGRLKQLNQAGWTIAYSDWRPGTSGVELPYRLTAERDAARVRLIVDQWQ